MLGYISRSYFKSRVELGWIKALLEGVKRLIKSFFETGLLGLVSLILLSNYGKDIASIASGSGVVNSSRNDSSVQKSLIYWALLIAELTNVLFKES